MKHVKDPGFNPLYLALPLNVRRRADRSFALLQRDPRLPSLHFKPIHNDIWSARVGRNYRALAIPGPDRFQWFWIGTHAEYDTIIGS